METKEISDILGGIGLTETEVKVYLALNELGTSTISPIVKKANISNSKIYIILEKLIKKMTATSSVLSPPKPDKRLVSKEKTAVFWH